MLVNSRWFTFDFRGHFRAMKIRAHLITHVETTPATTQDQQVVTSIHQSLVSQNLKPRQHLVDQGYKARPFNDTE